MSAARIRVLVVDDEPSVLLETSASLKRHYEVLTASRAEDAEKMLADQRVDLVLTDLRLPGKDGIALLESVKSTHPDIPVVLMSGHGTIEEALKAIRLGAVDFVEKPFGPERLQVTVERALELKALQRENERLRTLAGAADEMVGKSRALDQIRAEVAKVAKTDAKVLVSGESGTGKELVARSIHRQSGRSRGPFEKLNCAALPKDLVESELFGYEKGAFTGAAQMKRGRLVLADKGTLFLDEVGDMSLDTQAKFLRAIETGEIEPLGGTRTIAVDARILAATNRILPRRSSPDASARTFYRLNVVPIHIPPLRARREDVPLLVAHFVERSAPSTHADPGACRRKPWSGSPSTRGPATSGAEEPDRAAPHHDRRRHDRAGGRRGRAPRERGRRAAQRDPRGARQGRARHDPRQLRECQWNVSETSRRLGMDRGYLHRKIKRYGLSRDGAA